MPQLPSGTVTFLFTDIESSTRLLKQLRDRYGDVLAEHQRLLRAVFTETGGHEIKTQGDSFFVVFQRARDALDAAVRAQRSLATHEWPDGVELRVRMGIHTGEPRLGGDDYVGMGVHRAARIASVAHGGQVLLSSVTRELVEDDLPSGVALRDLGEHRLKDLDRLERIFQLVADDLPAEFPALKASSAAGEPDAFEPGESGESRADGFVGREEELRQMLDALAEAVNGRGRLVLIGGEPGIGKSRLVDEFARRATERRARVLWGRCWEAGGAPAYWPWVQAIRSYIRDAEPGALRAQLGRGGADVAQVLPELYEIFPDLLVAPSDDSEGARFRLFDSTSVFVREAAKSQPLVLIFDDVHAADTPSLLLLRFVAREIAESPVLVLATYRDVEAESDPQAESIGELRRLPTTRMMTLRGVSESEAERLAEVAAGRAVSLAVARTIYRETEGNPLFIGELIRLLASEDRLVEAVDGLAGMRLPHGVRDVIERRLSRLSEECARVLMVAAALGREFDLDVLANLEECEAEDLLDIVDEAIEAGVVGEVPRTFGRLRFSHALIREALYERLSTLRRKTLHRRAGEALELLYADDLDDHLAEVAHHFAASARRGDAERAVAYATRAAERAARLLAFEESTRLLRTALGALQLQHPVDDRQRCELLLALGDALGRAGETPGAKQTFLDAAEAARSLGNAELLARAALGYGGRFVWDAARGDPHLLPLLEEALAAPEVLAAPIRARVMARLAAGPLRDEVDATRREALSRRAVETAERSGDVATLAYALDARWAAIAAPDNLLERLDITERLLRAAQQAGDKERVLQAHHWRALTLLEAGDIDGVYAQVEAKARLADELRQPAQRWYLESIRPTLATLAGRFEEAEAAIPRAFALGEGTQHMAELYRLFHLFTLRREQGRLDEIVGDLRGIVARYPTYVVGECVLAHTLAELGRRDEASQIVMRFAETGFRRLPWNEEWLFGMSLLADVGTFLADASLCELLYDLLLPYGAQYAVSAPDGFTGSVSRNLGNLATSLAIWDAAGRHFELAHEMNRRVRSRPWVAHTEREYAAMLRARGGRDDEERAKQLLESALTTYDALGMPSFAAKIRDAAGLSATSLD